MHPFCTGRPLVLGGVTIPFPRGLQGHSDADVLIHAVIDALLGAAGAGDLGKHFPAADETFRNVKSLSLLEKTGEIIRGAGYEVENVDAVVIAESPLLAPYREQMEKNLGKTLGTHPARISVKATTTEGLGFTGQGLGIAALAVALLSFLREK